MSDSRVIDDRCVAWLREHGKGGYVKAFRLIRKETDTLDWCDFEDLVAIFDPLPPQGETGNEDDALTAMLSGLGISG